MRVEDGAGGSDTQALSITVTDTNDAPFVTGDAYTTVEEMSLTKARRPACSRTTATRT